MFVENENEPWLTLRIGVFGVMVKLMEAALGTQGRPPVQDATILPLSVCGVSPAESAVIVMVDGVLPEPWVTVSQGPPVCLLTDIWVAPPPTVFTLTWAVTLSPTTAVMVTLPCEKVISAPLMP